MMIAFGIAVIALGVLIYTVSRRQQNRMITDMAGKTMKWPLSRVYKPREIGGLYLQMKARFSKDEKTVKFLKLLAICSVVAGLAAVGIGLATR